MRIASSDRGSKGGACQLRSRSSFNPWNMPQSTSTRARSASIRYLDPVTVPTPPQKEIDANQGPPWNLRSLVNRRMPEFSLVLSHSHPVSTGWLAAYLISRNRFNGLSTRQKCAIKKPLKRLRRAKAGFLPPGWNPVRIRWNLRIIRLCNWLGKMLPRVDRFPLAIAKNDDHDGYQQRKIAQSRRHA